MAIDGSTTRDGVAAAVGYQRPGDEATSLRGQLHVVLTGPDGEVKYDRFVKNVITQIGDQRYAEAGAGISGPPAAPTGMQLGTGTTAPAKTGTGAASIGNVVANSLVAIGTPTSALNGSVRRITYTATWPAGTATANGISEVALVNQSTGTQTVAPTSASLSRALLSPTVNKGTGDSLSITYTHDIGS